MGHLLKIKCVDSRVNAHILASTKSPIYTVQVPNLALIHTKRITVCMHLIACFLCVGHSFAMSPICYFFLKMSGFYLTDRKPSAGTYLSCYCPFLSREGGQLNTKCAWKRGLLSIVSGTEKMCIKSPHRSSFCVS
jgi:hypothetical protein